MKKILFFLVLLFIPFSANADSASMYADMKIQKNGDIHVKQALILEGTYNAFELGLMYKYYDEFAIYSAEKTEIISVCEADIKGFNTVYSSGQCFRRVSSANLGDRRVYTLGKNGDIVLVDMFNPSSYGQKAFLIEYILRDVVVRHNDIAEIRIELLSKNFDEYFDVFEYRFSFADEVQDLKIWGHGPYYGEAEILSNKQASFKISNFKAEDLDARLTFDLDIVSESNKESNLDNMLQTIIDEETALADEANYCRELANTDVDRYQIECLHYDDSYYESSNPGLTFTKDEIRNNFILAIVWLVGLGIVVFTLYKKHDKEHRPVNKLLYFRDFPNDYSPDTVQYLIDKKVDSRALSASILDIIRKKGFTVEKTEAPAGFFKRSKEDFILTKNDEPDEALTESEGKVVQLMMDNFSFDKKTFKTTTINDLIMRESAARRFLKSYEKWVDESVSFAKKEELLEEHGTFWMPIIYAFIPVIATFMGQFLQIVLLPASIGLVFYTLSIKKYTHKGLDLFEKWSGLKRFLKDFGSFKDKDLPEVYLWEKYLVYATLFGYADRVKDILRVKMAEMNLNETDMRFFDNMMTTSVINHTIARSVASGVSSARSTIARADAARSGGSSSSSGGGGGGGFSGGGGGGGFSGSSGGSSGGRR